MDKKICQLLKYRPSNPQKTVYISNIDKKIKREHLHELLIQPSTLLNLYYPADRITNEHLGYCFAEYPSVEEAEYVIKVMNQVSLNGKQLKFSIAKGGYTSKIYVGNLCNMIDEDFLCDVFCKFGACEAKIPRNSDGSSKGYGFIYCESKTAADLAIRKVDGRVLCGKRVNVAHSKSKI
jgi:splicing factor 3B subunit 4